MGLMLGPASTDAVNRASRLSYGEATGITQTVRNYAASLGLAILGTILVVAAALARHHVADRAGRATGAREHRGVAASPSPHGSGRPSRRSRTSSGSTSPTPPARCCYVMAGVMAAAAIVAFLGLRRGVQEETDSSQAEAPALA